MEITVLKSFIAVAKHQSFSNAAKELHLTQPAISKRVASLEAELGLDLFQRVSRTISLTDAGYRLLPKALELVAQAEDMQRYASNLNKEVSGKLRIALAHHIGLHRMPPILKNFSQQYTQVALDIYFEDSDRALDKVEQGEIEFAVITLPCELGSPLKSQPVWVDPLSIVVGRNHPLLSCDDISAQDLRVWPCVLPESTTETHKIIDRQISTKSERLNIQMKTNNLESLKMLVAAGIGWSALPNTMLDNSVQVLECGLTLIRQLGMVFHKKRSLSNSAKAMVEMVQQHADF